MTIYPTPPLTHPLGSSTSLEQALELPGTRPLLLLRVDIRFDHEKHRLSEHIRNGVSRAGATLIELKPGRGVRPALFPLFIQTLAEKASSREVPIPTLVNAALSYIGHTQQGTHSVPRDVDRMALFEALKCLSQTVAGPGACVVLTTTPMMDDLDLVDFIDYLRTVEPSSAGQRPDLGDGCNPTNQPRVPNSEPSVRSVFRWVGLLSPDAILPTAWTTDRRFRHDTGTGDEMDAVQNWLQSSAVKERVLRVTGGNPQYLHQLLQMLPQDTDDLILRPGRALTGLAGEIRDALVCAHKPLRVRFLAQLIGQNEMAVGRTINALRDAGFVCSSADHTGMMWACARSAAVLKEDVFAEKRRQIANQLGDLAVEQWLADGNVEALQEAVWRYLEAGNTANAIGYGLEAASVAEQAMFARTAWAIVEQLLALPTEPQTRVEVLRRAARLCATLGDFGRAVGYAEQLFKQVGALDSEDFRGELAKIFVTAGQVTDAIAVLMPASTGGKSASIPSTAAHVALLADAYRMAGKLDDALAVCRGFVGTMTPEVSLAYGSVCYRRGDYTEAQHHYTNAANAPSAPWDIAARAKHNLGLIALASEKYAEAARHLQEGLQLCESHGELRGAALGRYNLGIALEHLERFPVAERLLSAAVDTFLLSGQQQLLCSALITQADLMLRLGEPKQAHQLAQRALDLASDHHLEYGAAAANARLGMANLERGRLGPAAQQLSEAARWFKDAKSPYDLAWTLAYLTEVALQHDDLEQAQIHLDELWDNSSTAGSELAGMTRLCDGLVRVAGGDYAEADRLATDAGSFFERVGQREGQVRCLDVRSQALWAMGQHDHARHIQQLATTLLANLSEVLPEAKRPRFLARRVFTRLVKTSESKFAGVAETTPEVPRMVAVDDNTAERAWAGASTAIGTVDWQGDGVVREKHRLWPAHHLIPKLLGNSPSLRQSLEFATKVARSEMPVLLLGESGTGKELVAQGIVDISPRAAKPFVRVNVASFAENLLESELFGHERGAFTGALARRHGAFEQADGGTLFLDEIGDISPKMQVSLLRVLQEGEVVRVGGNQPVKVNVRILCATNRNLERMIQEGLFRLDLYHRICGFAVKLPPLRDRHDDVVLLAAEFIRRHNDQSGQDIGMTPSAVHMLKKHVWPGNVRELEQVIRSALLLAENATITKETLTQSMSSVRISPAVPGDRGRVGECDVVGGLDAATRHLEVEMIRRALEHSGGNITRAADLLCIKRPRLSLKIKEYGIVVPYHKEP